MQCPNEDTLLAVVEGRLTADSQPTYDHIESCPSCRALLNELARSHGQDGDEPSVGQHVGRYELRSRIGIGGMGVVYSARDPDLERDVAIKLLRSDVDRDVADLRARLLREAQAMARLSHPNVIAVWDVGLHGDHVFIAMELLDGQTLRQWLDEQPRSWRELLAVLLPAGRGLAAAHAVGIVHRDFKPENVMIRRDGGVRVLDFGLARAASEELRSRHEAAPSEVLRAATATGALMGTPAYMAPEQFRGRAAVPESDQFSFCVVLYRALFGQAPFAGDTVEELAEAVSQGRLRPPPKANRVPARVREAVMRGLAGEPSARWPSMGVLLLALDRARASTRRRWIASGVAVGVAATLALGYRDVRRRERLVCHGGERSFVGVWDDARKQQMHAAMLATGKPFAEDAFRGAVKTLDAYANGWVRAHADACEATQVRHEQSEELLDLRMECLDQRLHEVKAQVDLLTSADATTVEKAVQMTAALASVASCGDVVQLRSPVRPPNRAARARVAALRKELARAKALHEAGRYADARKEASKLAEAARQLGYQPLLAEVLLQLGRAQIATGEAKAAEKTLEEAVLAAEAGRADRTLVEARTQEVRAVGIDQARVADGTRLADHAAAVLERLGGDDRLRARLLVMRGYLEVVGGRAGQGLADGQRAVALWEGMPDAPPPELAAAQLMVASALQGLGRYRDAIPYQQRALALWERAVGPSHPVVSSALGNLGGTQRGAGMYEEALASLERSLAIAQKTRGPMDPKVAQACGNVAGVLADLGRYEEARVDFERALAVDEHVLPPDHPEVAHVLTGLAEVLLRQHQPRQALALGERALAIRRRAFGDGHPTVAYTLTALAEVDSEQGRFARALARAQEAVRILRTQVDGRSPELANALVEDGRAQLGLDAAAKAIPIFEQAEQVYRDAGTAATTMGEVEFLLARALWRTGERTRARAVGQQALESYRDCRTKHEQVQRDAIQAWLALRQAS